VASGEDSVKQRTDDLFWEWARLLRDLYPRAFVAENVPGMLMGDALEDYARKITTMLGELGYRVSAQVINAAQYGAPQERRRLIFVGFRDDVRGGPFQFPPPTITRAVTLGQALDSVDPDDPDHAPYLEDSSMEPYAVGRTWKRLMEIRAHNGTPGNGWLDEGELAGEDCERCGKPLDREEFHEVLQRSNEGTIMKARCADGERAHIIKAYFTLCVPLRERPCPTLTATGASPGAASVTHPSECRKLTPAEAKAVCGFPPDFKLLGSRSQRYERMGRAVPPPVYDVIGREIARRLKEEY
jgi:DNA (cytosine-5)-methyltransferase 1